MEIKKRLPILESNKRIAAIVLCVGILLGGCGGDYGKKNKGTSVESQLDTNVGYTEQTLNILPRETVCEDMHLNFVEVIDATGTRGKKVYAHVSLRSELNRENNTAPSHPLEVGDTIVTGNGCIVKFNGSGTVMREGYYQNQVGATFQVFMPKDVQNTNN